MAPTLFLASALVALSAVACLQKSTGHRGRLLLLGGVGAFYVVMVGRQADQAGALFLVVPAAASLTWARAKRVVWAGFAIAGVALLVSALRLSQLTVSPIVQGAITAVGGAVLTAAIVLQPPRVAANGQAASNAMAWGMIVATCVGVMAAGPSMAAVGPMGAAFIIAVVTALRTGSGRLGDRRTAMTFLVIASLGTGAVFLNGGTLVDAVSVSTALTLGAGAAMILSPRLLAGAGATRLSAHSGIGPSEPGPPPLADAALAHVVPLWADTAARGTLSPLVMTRVSAREVIDAAQVALRRHGRAHSGAQLTLDVAAEHAELDFDGDAPRMAEALAILLDSALDRGPGIATLALRGDARVLVFEISDSADVAEARPAIPERIRPFRDRGGPIAHRGASFAQHIVEQHGGTVSTRLTSTGRIRQIELPRRQQDRRVQHV